MTKLELVVMGVRDAFPDVGDLALDETTRLEELPDWDSMAAVNLQMSLEEQLGIEFPLEFLRSQTTLAEIAQRAAG